MRDATFDVLGRILILSLTSLIVTRNALASHRSRSSSPMSLSSRSARTWAGQAARSRYQSGSHFCQHASQWYSINGVARPAAGATFSRPSAIGVRPGGTSHMPARRTAGASTTSSSSSSTCRSAQGRGWSSLWQASRPAIGSYSRAIGGR